MVSNLFVSNFFKRFTFEEPFSMTPIEFSNSKSTPLPQFPHEYPNISPKKTYEAVIVSFNTAKKEADENYKRNIKKAEEFRKNLINH